MTASGPGPVPGDGASAWAYRLALGVIVVVGAALAARWSLAIDEWRVMTDEMTYLKAAQSMADTLSPSPVVRGYSIGSYAVLYPMLLAPLVGWFDLPTAFRVAHGLGALSMASAAVPTYLLTRYVARSRWAALAAAAPVAVGPWLLLSLNLLTEVLAYPVFVWAVYACVVAVADARGRNDALALVALGLAFLTRTQFVVLFGVLVAAIVLHELGMALSGRSPRRWVSQGGQGLRAAATGHTVLLVAVAAAFVLWLLSSMSLPLGAYSDAIDTGELFPAGFRQAAYEHFNQILFGIAVLPFTLALAFVAEALWRPTDRRAHALAIWLALTTPLLLFIATNFDLTVAGGVQQRYIFYVVPLLLVGAACYLQTSRWPLPVLAGSTVVTALLVTRSAYEPFTDGVIFASPARPPWVALDYRVEQVAGLFGIGNPANGTALALGCAVAAAAVVVVLRRQRRAVAIAAVGLALTLWSAALTLYSAPKVRAEHESLAVLGLASAKRPMDERDWIDRAVPSAQPVALLPSAVNARDGKAIPLGSVTDQGVWWEAEFWNRSVRRSFRYRESMDYTPYVSDRVRLDPRTGALRVTNGETPYLVGAASDVRLAPAGDIVARSDDLVLYRPRRPYRASWATRALSDNGELRGRRVGLDVYGSGGSSPRRHTVSIVLAGQTAPKPLIVRTPGSRAAIRVFGRRAVTRALCVPARGRSTVRLESPPAPNLRVVGVRVRIGGRC